MTEVGPKTVTPEPTPTLTPAPAPAPAPAAATPAVPTVPVAPVTPEIEGPRIPDNDPDMLALKAAEEELAAEEKGALDPKTAEPSPEDKGVVPAPAPVSAIPEPGATPDPEPKPDEKITIPKARFDEVLARSREAHIDAIRKDAENKTLRDLLDRGVIQPHQVPGGDPVPGQGPKPFTVQERVVSIREQQRNLAGDFDAGKIAAKDWETKRQDLDDQVLELRLSESRSSTPAPGPQTEDLLLSERTDQIATQYPIVQQLTEDHLKPLAKIAVATMDFEGATYNPKDPASVLDLRTRIAKMADQAYEMDGVPSPSRQSQPAATKPADPQTPAPGAPTGTTPAAPQSPVTAAQRKDKLALAEQQPTSLTSAPGTGQAGLDAMDEETFVALSTEEIAALPKEMLDRIEAQGL